MAAIPGTGHPDGEDRAMPHGENLSIGFSKNATVGGFIDDNSAAGYHVAAYRSLVVVVRNRGTFPIVVTPRWRFYDASANVYSESSKTVAAGARTRLLFQNEADFIDQVKFAGSGGTSLFDYYFVGSNLDPLPLSKPDWLLLQGLLTNVTNPVVGDNDHGKFDATKVLTNDASDWSFVLDAGGNIKEVDVTRAGLYVSYCQFKWAAAGAAYDRTTLLNFSADHVMTYNGVTFIGMSPDDRIKTADAYDSFVGAMLPLDAANGIFTIQPNLAAVGNANFTPVYWWIHRYELSGL